MKKYLIFVSLIILIISCDKKSNFRKDDNSSNTEKKVLEDTTTLKRSKTSQTFDFKEFDLFFINFKRVIETNDKKRIANFVDFPFNEDIIKEAFLKKYKISEDVKNLISHSIPEEADSLYIINSDSYDIRFIINKNGYWKLKSIYEGD